MNTCLSLGLIILNIFVSSIQFDPIKFNITSVIHYFANTEYLDPKLTLTLNNNGYTEMKFYMEVLKDFPEETVYITKLSRSKSENGPWEDVQTYVAKVCDLLDKYHDILPTMLVEITRDGKCILKRKYESDDAGQFQFYKLLPAASLKGWYFNALNEVRTSNPDGVLIKKYSVISTIN